MYNVFQVCCLVYWVRQSLVWSSDRASYKLYCEFRYILYWLQSQIPSLEFEIINSIRFHL